MVVEYNDEVGKGWGPPFLFPALHSVLSTPLIRLLYSSFTFFSFFLSFCPRSLPPSLPYLSLYFFSWRHKECRVIAIASFSEQLGHCSQIPSVHTSNSVDNLKD
jgi:hypothetical protein